MLVTAVSGIAAGQGFRTGDVILAVNGRRTATTSALSAALQAEQWTVTLLRDGREVQARF